MLFDSICDTRKTVIDIGCGNGLFTKIINDKFKSILSIDINPIRVKNLKEHFENSGIQNVTVLEMSAYAIEMNDTIFDEAIFYRSVDHMSNYYLALKEAYRVLKHQGGIYINILDTRYATNKTINLDNFRNFADELYDVLKIAEGMCELKQVDIEKLYLQLEEIGFSNIKTDISKNESIEKYFDKIDKDISDLLEEIKFKLPNEYTKYDNEYMDLLEKIKSEGIEFRPTVEIIGMK
jgi:ubiquinone/menaquinone biosynthesis C-methylase UbiE